MNFTENLALNGELSITKIYPDGRREEIFTDSNMITNSAKTELLSFLTTSGKTSSPISQFKVGTGGTLDSNGLYPKSPDPTRSNLYTPTLTSTSVVLTPSTEGSGLGIKAVLLVVFDLQTTDAVGSLISEVGLFKTDGSMFSFKNFAGIAKTGDFSLHFNWKISLAGQPEVSNRIVTLSSKVEMLSYLHQTKVSNPLTTLYVGNNGLLSSLPRILTGTESDMYDTTPLLSSTIFSKLLGIPSPSYLTLGYLVSDTDSSTDGQNINELAFKKENGTLFSLAVFPSIPKSSAFSLDINWIIGLL